MRAVSLEQNTQIYFRQAKMNGSLGSHSGYAKLVFLAKVRA
jgi:hypothetical protein